MLFGDCIAVFLTRQMPTWLPTWFFSATSKVQNGRKTPLPKQIVLTTYLKEFQRYFQIYLLYSLSFANCKQLRKCNCLYRLLLSAMLFFQWILDPISLGLIWSYNFLAFIPRHDCSVSYRNSVSKMRIASNVLYISSQKTFWRFKTKSIIWPSF